MSRAQNSFKNIVAANASQVLLVLLNFLIRTIFVKTLGEEYLGINGLFSNILTVLSLADLGIGGAVIFKLYKPIEENDQDGQIALMDLYRRLCVCIGFVVAAFGILLIPFLKHIIKDYDSFASLGINPVIILLLYVFQTASSYWFFAYKQAVVYAHQKTYLLTVRSYFVSIASCICQMLVLLFWKDFLVNTFIAYTVVLLLFVIIQNTVFSFTADKYFPYLKSRPKRSVPINEIKSIFKDSGALFIYKANIAVINATDNIVLSALVSLSSVGMYSNYRVVFTNIKVLLDRIIDSIGASIGSIHATGNIEWKRNIFAAVNFATVFMYGVVSVPFAVVGDEFIKIWLGERFVIDSFSINGQIIPISLSVLIAIELYQAGQFAFLSKFRNGFGLFKQYKYRPIISMVINLVITVILVPHTGPAGAVIGTIAAYTLTFIIFDPIVIIKNELHTSLKRYYLKNVLYAVVVLISGVIAKILCSFIKGGGWITLIIHGCISVFVVTVVFLLSFIKTKEFYLLLTFVPNGKIKSFFEKLCSDEVKKSVNKHNLKGE